MNQPSSRTHQPISAYWAKLGLCLLALTLSTQTGCNLLNRFNHRLPQPPVVLNESTSLEQLVQVLNDQSSRVNQINTDVRVSMSGAPAMRGTLSMERPDRMRLKASVAGISALDVGSNSDRFWIWTQVAMPGQPPTLMFARHLEFETSPIRRQIPLDPAWLIDGLGFADFSPTDQHRGPYVRPEDGLLEIHTFRQTATGQNIRKCVVNPRTGLISQQSFYDQNGQLIAYLDAKNHKYYESNQVSLPRRLELTVLSDTGETTKLTIDAGEYSINSLYGDPDRLWSMPNPPDVNKVDLSTVQPVIRPTGETASNQDSLSYSRRQPTSNTRRGLFRR